MKTAAKSFRAFQPEFLAYLRKRGGPPRHAAIRAWFSKNYEGSKNDYLRDLKNGRYAPEKYATGFIQMLLDSDDDPDFAPSRRALADFLRARSFPADPAGADLDGILSHTCTPVINQSPDELSFIDRTKDHLAQYPQFLLQAPIKYMLRHMIQGCDPERRAVDEVVGWMFIRVGQLTSPAGVMLPHAEAIAIARDFIGSTLDDYTRKAKEWQRHNPWIIVRAMQRGKPVGMSTVLPVTETAYHRVLDGQHPSFAVGQGDLCIPSNHLIIEACTESPFVLSASRVYPNYSLAIALSLQVAALMRCQESSAATEYRWLSFAGTPVSKERLLGRGFVATGKTMAATGVELFERYINFESGEGATFSESHFLTLAGKACPPAPYMGRG